MRDYEFPNRTFEQTAKTIGCSVATLHRMLARGEGPPSYKVGGRRYFRDADIVDWLEKTCRQEPQQAAQ